MVIAIFSFIVAPLLQLAPNGLWEIIRVLTGFYNIPIIAIVLVGLFFRRVPALGAKVAIVFHVIAYAIFRFVWQIDIHYVHVYAILFAMNSLIMLAFGYFRPMDKSWKFISADGAVEMKPWKYAYPASFMLLAAIIWLYLTFSPIGLAGKIGSSYWAFSAVTFLLAIAASIYSLRLYDKKYPKEQS